MPREKNIYDGCEKANGDGKKTWKVIRKAMNFKPKPEVTPNFVKTGTVAGDNIKKTKNKTDIANVMNKQFSEMGAKLADKLDPPETHFTD